ncbi:uncharacterized protein Tco025E_04179 [Trypanosoma conorhini]|uniref:Uncharacterized protein n=1 Tax=Trypanosoma conorhini TaxID=83891 RepID=A0A422PNZ5_9TRYP|nr:uncharacterized protein Tco025E_04179 [Trypanosoma conorhini]RNF19422.1 hypothetical protein Tco025E_04179 [Trypanosoma conorhini]
MPAAAAVADIELLPHHAVLLAHAKMLISVFDCGTDAEAGNEGEAHLVGSAALPPLDVILATVEQGNRCRCDDATQRMKGGATVAQNVELPPWELPLHRCSRRVGTLCLACSPPMCTSSAAAAEEDLL